MKGNARLAATREADRGLAAAGHAHHNEMNAHGRAFSPHQAN
jgi:hypothetical protein